MFTEKESSYLESQPLARLATVTPDMQPDASAVGFDFDGQFLFVSGKNMANSRNYKNVQNGNTKVAIIVDDLQSVDPWRPTGIRIFGTAEIIQRGQGPVGPGECLKIAPTISRSWNIEGPAFVYSRFAPNRTVHE